MPLATGAAHGVPIQLSPTEASSGYFLRPVVDAVGGGQNNASYLGFLLHSPYVGERDTAVKLHRHLSLLTAAFLASCGDDTPMVADAATVCVDSSTNDLLNPSPQDVGGAEAACPPAPPAPGGLRAAFWEIADKQTAMVGLKDALEGAGWKTIKLPLGTPPDQLRVDAIILGSFVSEDPRYAPYIKANTASIERFLDTGGTLLQFTQGHQVEPTATFLPTGLSFGRTDTDITGVFAVIPTHTLVRGLAVPGRSDQLIDLPSPTPPSGIPARPACWDCPNNQSGFTVIVAGRRDGEFPALMEAGSSSGLGRLVVSGLHLDKVQRPNGEVAVEPEVAAASASFFRNLRIYVEALQRGELPLPVPTPSYVTPAPTTLQPGSATVVVFPDTQNYSFQQEGFDGGAIFRKQTSWANDNLSSLSTVFMFNVGDIVEHNVASEWMTAVDAFSLLSPQQPFLLSTGNHDHGPNGAGSTRGTAFDQFFPTQRFRSMATFGGALDTAENSYHLVEILGQPWIVLGLEWAPRNSTLEWARGVLASNPGRRAIVSTHAYMFFDETRYDYKARSRTQSWNPHWYFGNTAEGAMVNDGQEIWEKLISISPNVRFVVSGHVAKEGIGRMVSKNVAGHDVHQLAFNYQDYPMGGSGYLRIFEFLADKKTVRVRTYSPHLDKNLTDDQNQFELTVDP